MEGEVESRVDVDASVVDGGAVVQCGTNAVKAKSGSWELRRVEELVKPYYSKYLYYPSFHLFSYNIVDCRQD